MNISYKLFWGIIVYVVLVLFSKRRGTWKTRTDILAPGWFSVTGRGVVSFAQKFKEAFKATTEKTAAQGPGCGLCRSPLPGTQSSHGFGTSTAGQTETPNTSTMWGCAGECSFLPPSANTGHSCDCDARKDAPLGRNLLKNCYLLNVLLPESQGKADVNLLI